ncbi:hypothetical protein GGR56DRAFT_2962 [Xylariaceae sp. FL0804]|nr:hypothetical protein GGR56DRAFT_2962 [Xylariaceae sp. FL0804]
MLRRRHALVSPALDYADCGGDNYPVPRSGEACSSRAFDLVPKRSGTHNLSRTGYNEEKCRNVLVRYCAHIPRNYQYKDGVQQIFLILREHLGDENVDLGGGVLYELIEVDCEHSDDPGAAFQRWRHDHMYRYADLELPHVPHMTTITASIIPTERLTRWRLEHRERYPFVLSDSSPSAQRLSIDPTCIRNRKAWLIDHTLYVSTRNDGTRPLNSPNPKQFHEMQWNLEFGRNGRFIEERDVPVTSLDRTVEVSAPDAADTLLSVPSFSRKLRHSLSSLSIIDKVVDKLGKTPPQKEPQLEQRRRSWLPSTLRFETGSLFRDKGGEAGANPISLPEGRQIPNAIFARKFLLVDRGESLPASLPICQMPTAESKATDTIVEAAAMGLLDRAQSWSFRGPFTPQLGFDGGLDYQWGHREPTITIRRFDLEAHSPDTPGAQLSPQPDKATTRTGTNALSNQPTTLKRRGRFFDSQVTGKWEKMGPRAEASDECRGKSNNCHVPGDVSPGESDEGSIPVRLPASPPYTPPPRSKLRGPVTRDFEGFATGQHGLRRRNPSLFENIEFAIQAETLDPDTPISNRKATLIERSGQQLDHSSGHSPGHGPESQVAQGPVDAFQNEKQECRPLNVTKKRQTDLDGTFTMGENSAKCFERTALASPGHQVLAHSTGIDCSNACLATQSGTLERLLPLRYDANKR